MTGARTMALVTGAALCFASSAVGAELKKRTIQAFEEYIRATESRLAQRLSEKRSFLWTDESPERKHLVRHGEIVVESLSSLREADVPGGLIHDWIGAVFMPGATIEKTLALVQDYNHHRNVYGPEVIDSKIRSHDGNQYRIYLRLLKKKVLTVVLNTEHEVRYFSLDSKRWHSRSYSTRIAEVQNPGKPTERELPVGNDNGFLWRLYSYWRFQERDGGVFIECEAISLTRDVPTGLGWLVEPIIRDLPRESLSNTLRATRAALIDSGEK